MPPLVSEELDDFTEESRAVSGAASSDETNSKASHPVQESTTSDTDMAATDDVHVDEDADADADGEEDVPVGEAMDMADDSELVAQLQRSAHEEDGDGGEAESNQAEDAVEHIPSRDKGTSSPEAAEVTEKPAEENGPKLENGSESESDSNDEDDEESESSSTSSSAEDEDEAEVEESEEGEGDENEDDEDEDTSESEDEEDGIENDHCIFCNKSTDAHQDTQTAAYVTCSTCSNHAHQKCARDNDGLKDKEDVSQWRCPTCSKQTDSESPKSVLARARASNSAPRLVRDLLPVSRGVQKPNAHSIFEQPLISDGEDGGRSLRKRKSPTQEPPPTDKRRRKATAASTDMVAVDATLKGRAVAHSTRSALQPQRTVPLARILQHRPFHKPPPHKFILAFRLGQEAIAEILSKPPKPGRRARKQKQPKIPPPPVYQPPVPKFPALPSSNFFPSLFSDRESDAKPYGGILSEQDADTSRSLPQHRDREIFEMARKEAEEERRKASEAAEAEINGDNSAAGKPSRTVSGPPSKIKCIQFGKYVIDTFYAAPYPEEYSHESRLFICEFCLKYLPSEFVAYRHKLKCPAKHPPGDEIYRDGSISIWEVDGRKKTEYCQCLCLMAKMFLGSKTLYYDVEPFLFYILTEYDEMGYHFVGYFSKEKRPASQNNVSCILVMPIHQRKGYAMFLIDFSYLLTRIEEKEGSPEKPLSDMGLTAYRAYWDLTISRHLLKLGMKPFSTKTLMALTGMTADDVIHSLERLYAFTRDPATKTFAIRYDKKLYETIVSDFDSKKHRQLVPEKLIWTPYVMGRSDQAHLDNHPTQTIAPREEGVEDEDESSKVATEAVSPRTTSVPLSRALTEDPALIDDSGVVAPGPPSTDILNGGNDKPKINGVAETEPEVISVTGEALTGYALAYRTYNIPPMRFQITPPIPAAMLRNRSIKKRTTATPFGRLNTNAKASPTPILPTRSSPRNAGSSVNGRSSRGGSEERNLTPMRRSGRRSGLANVELASLDGSNDKSDETDAMEIEAPAPEGESSEQSGEDGEDEEDEDEEEEASSEEDEEEDDEEEDDEEEEVDDDDEEKDPDAEPEEDEESSSEEDEEEDVEDDAAEVEELAGDQEDDDNDDDDEEEEEEDVDAEGEDDEDAPGEDDV